EGHHQNQVAEYFPVFAGCAHYCTKSKNTIMLPSFRFFDVQANVESQQCWHTTYPKHCPPSPHGKNETCSDRRQDIANGISALQDTRKNAPPSLRNAFHSERRANPPFTTHANSIDRTQNEECRVIRRKAAEQLDH